MQKIETPGARTIEALSKFIGTTAEDTLKTLIVEGVEQPVALVLRGDHELNAIKAQKIPGVATPLTMADSDTIRRVTGCGCPAMRGRSDSTYRSFTTTRRL